MSQDASDDNSRSLLAGVLNRFRSADRQNFCSCGLQFNEEELVVDASDCDGDLATSSKCRRTVTMALRDRDVNSVIVRSEGLEYHYGDDAVALLTATGRFVDLVEDRNQEIAESAAADPLKIAREVRTRTGAVSDIGEESGLTHVAEGVSQYDTVFSPAVGPTIAHYIIDQSVGDEIKFEDLQQLETGSEARIYSRGGRKSLYALDVVDVSLDEDELALLTEAYEAIAEGVVEGDRAPSKAIDHVADGPVDPVLSSILEKHTQGYGILEDLFADPRVSDVYATSPVSTNPLRVVVDGESMSTNIYLTSTGAKALSSRVRRTSGRSFSRASPTVENNTMTAEVAAFLSVAIRRNAAMLIAGTRGAGKTTLLGTLLYELPSEVRTVIIEDTPELPVESLQSVGRDIQALRVGTGEGPEISSTEALRTALRLGDGALVMGEIRGEEAQVLYEAMRVGASANAVLGTIHGDGAEEVKERVVSDLDVELSSFAATDLVVTVQILQTEEGRQRRLSRIEEVRTDGEGVTFEPLYQIDDEMPQPTGVIDRGGSRVVDDLARPGESYADVREEVIEQRAFIDRLAKEGRTSPQEVAAAYAER